MAITRLDSIPESDKYVHNNLRECIKRVCNPKKTENGLYISGNAGLTVAGIYHTFLLNKWCWGKEDERQGYHYMVSFAPEDAITPKGACRFAREFAQELLEDQYFFVIAVHTDTDKLHFHLVFDSVSRIDGKKYRSPKGDWAHRIQPITDRLCEKYNLSVLDYSWKAD